MTQLMLAPEMKQLRVEVAGIRFGAGQALTLSMLVTVVTILLRPKSTQVAVKQQSMAVVVSITSKAGLTHP